MRKLDRLLMGNLLPVSAGLSAQIAKVSAFHRDPVPNVITYLLSYLLSCIRRQPSHFNSVSTTTHDKIPNLSVRMCDSMLTVKDGPGVYRGQFFRPNLFCHTATLFHHTNQIKS
jgi:hypothetical protein